MEQRLKDIGIPYCFIEAINGEETLKRYDGYHTWYTSATLDSHIKAIEQAKLDDNNISIIIEDDIILKDNFKALLETNLIKNIPDDTGLFYFGFIPPVSRKYEKGIYKMQGEEGAFGYCIRNNYIDTVLTKLNTKAQPVDTMLAELHYINNSFCIIPLLCYVEDGYSDISREEVSFPHIKKLYYY